jgi:Predicted metal-dependent hydrolase of the TIM-barrel fold
MIQDIPDPEWMLRAAVGPAVAHLQHLGLSFDALVKPRHLEPLRRFLRLYPELESSSTMAPSPISRAASSRIGPGRCGRSRATTMSIARSRGLVTEAAPDWQPGDLTRYLDLLLEAFGPARLMWGSDWPVVDLAGGYDRWRDAALDYLARLGHDERRAILGRTAAEFYRLQA